MKRTFSFKLYYAIIVTALSVVILLAVMSLFNAFKSLEAPTKVEGRFVELSYWFDDFQLRQTKEYDKEKGYLFKNEIYLSNIQVKRKASFQDTGWPVFVNAKSQARKIQYHPLFNTLVIDLNEKTLSDFNMVLNLTSLFIFVMIGLILFKTKQILSSLKKGSPFNMDNYKRLIFIGTVLFSIPVMDIVLRYFLENFSFSRLDVPANFAQHFVHSYFSYLWYCAGLLVYVFAYVVHEGIKLQEEQDLTV